jgi:hypothetical protein
MKDYIGLSFDFRGKTRNAKAKILRPHPILFEIRWKEDDLIWDYGKRFYVSESSIQLVGNQKPPKDAVELKNIIIEMIMAQQGITDASFDTK